MGSIAVANEQLATVELCGEPLKSRPGEACQGPVVREGRCIRHVPAAVAGRAAAVQKTWRTRRRQRTLTAPATSALPRPDAEPLRLWIRKQVEQRGFEFVSQFCCAAKLRPLPVTRFLNGRTAFLSAATISSFAAYTGEPEAALLSLQSNMTAEEHRRQVGRENLATLRLKYPKGDPLWKEVAKKALPHARAGLKRWHSDTEAVARSCHTRSLTTLRKQANDQSSLAFQRWAAARMVNLDMDRAQLAAKLRWPMVKVYRILCRRSKNVPSIPTVSSIESALGPMPPHVLLAVRNARSQKSGGRKSQERLKSRAAKWTRERLESEIDKLGEGARSDAVQLRIRNLRYGKALGRQAYEILVLAKISMARVHLRPPRTRPGGGVYLTTRGRLLTALHGLERSRSSKFYQCQNCGRIWIRGSYQSRGELCAPCWDEYQPSLSAWQMSGQRGPSPSLPRRPGPLIDPRDLQRRVIALLRYTLGELPEPPDPEERKVLSDIKRRLEASTHPRCQTLSKFLSSVHEAS